MLKYNWNVPKYCDNNQHQIIQKIYYIYLLSFIIGIINNILHYFCLFGINYIHNNAESTQSICNNKAYCSPQHISFILAIIIVLCKSEPLRLLYPQLIIPILKIKINIVWILFFINKILTQSNTNWCKW